MNIKYYQTKSLTKAMANQYVSGYSFMKFTDINGRTIYSFMNDDYLKEKIKNLEFIKFK